MDLRDPPVIAGQKAVEDLGQPDPGLAVDPAHDPEVDRGEPAVGEGEEIALVEVGVEEAVDHRLAKEGADQDRRQGLEVVARLDQRIAVVELDAVDPFERQHPPRGPGPVDRGDVEAALRDQILAQLGSGSRLAAKVELARRPLAEIGDDGARAQPGRLAAHLLDLGRGPFVGVEGALEILLDIGAEHLDRDQPPVGRVGAVDLGDRGGADRLRVDVGENLLERLLQPLLDRPPHRLERGRRKAVLEQLQVARRLDSDEVGPGRQRLAELDRRRPELLEGLAVGRDVRHASSEARDPGEPPHRLRRVGIALDAAQRAVPGEHPPPFEETPDMDDGTGQIFQPLWMATRPPRIGSALTRAKPALAIIAEKPSIGGKRRIDSTR